MKNTTGKLTTGLSVIALSVIVGAAGTTSAKTLSAVSSTVDNAPIEVTAAHDIVPQATQGDFMSVDKNETQRYIITFKETKTPAKISLSDRFSRSSRTTKLPSTTDINKAVVDGKLNETAAATILKTVGATQVRTLSKHKMMVVKMSKDGAIRLASNPNIDNISIDEKRTLMAESTPYGISMVQGTQLAQNNLSARKVCVIDTGYNLGHPDLPNQNNGVTGNANNNQVGNWYNDGNGHGTHVAGTIAALSNNTGVVGVYPGVDLHIVKIFNDSGSWTFASDLITAIDQCQSAGADVVNMSLGGGSATTAERNAMQGFADDGILLVAAAGNAGNSTKSYPASYPAVMSVAAVDSSENRASYSQYNDAVEIAGPGSAVNSTWPVNTYNSISGTSMATPHVVGAAALVWSFFPSCSNEQIRSALNETAKDKGSAGKDNLYGYGIVKAADAYDYINTYGCAGDTGGGGGGGSVTPVSGQLTNLSDSRNNWKRYTWNVPAGVSTLTVRISGGTGDADLYMKLGSEPSTSSYDCRPYRTGNAEVCTFSNPQAGAWNIGIRAYAAYSRVTMNYSYE